MRYLYLLLTTNFKTVLTLKAAFIGRFLLTVIDLIVFFVGFSIAFFKYENIKGYTIRDIAFAWGISIIIYSVLPVFFQGNGAELARKIEQGELDGYLLVPKNVWLSVVASKSDPAGLAFTFGGGMMLWFSGYITWANFPLLILMIFLGIIIFVSLFSILGSLAFWFGGAHEWARQYLNMFLGITNMPAGIYTGFFKVVVYTILPAGVITFVPLDVIQGSFYSLGYIFGAAVFFFALAVFVFKKGLKRYSGGNVFTYKGF
ncbi:MAG: ABC-2 family transporter protein [Lactobacillales bacterium]|jgi:ABC-2 type transport system permease protein|nr:ABC-2 family transporter protein [Lactobacillales bacterium]